MARYCSKPLSLEPFTTNLSKNVSLNDFRNSSKRYLPSPHEFSRYIFRWIALLAFITFDYRYQFQSRLSYNSQQIFRTSYVWLSNAFDSRGNTLSLSINLNTRLYFLTLPRHLTEPYTFLSGKPEMSMDSSTSMRNDTYLLTLQVNCATICQMRKHTTPTRPQLTSSDYFCEKTWQKCWAIRARHLQKRDFKTKTNDRVTSRLAIGL